MEDELKRLLDTELRAEAMVEAARAEREQIMQQALHDARIAEQRFEHRIPELHGTFRTQAEDRAEQTVAELRRRYEERHKLLRSLAQKSETEAIEAALALLTDPARV